jgi:hypothetical protein
LARRIVDPGDRVRALVRRIEADRELTGSKRRVRDAL